MKLKQGDRVVVIAGASKGHIGVISEVDLVKGRIIVDGANLKTKNIKPSQDNPEGGQDQVSGWMDASNAMIILDQKSKDGEVAEVSKIKVEIVKDKHGRTSKKRLLKKNGMEV